MSSEAKIGERTKCEVYSRVVGYFRPLSQWNEGKQSEYAERREYEVRECKQC